MTKDDIVSIIFGLAWLAAFVFVFTRNPKASPVYIVNPDGSPVNFGQVPLIQVDPTEGK